MTPREQIRATLWALWSGPLADFEIVRRYSGSHQRAFGKPLSLSRLADIWQLGRDNGHLPAKGDRPRNVHAAETDAADRAQKNQDIIDLAGDGDLFDLDLDDDEIFIAPEANAKACAQSLAALRRHHPSLDQSSVQDAPADWLKRECDPHYYPTPALLMSLAAGADAAARESRKKRSAA